MGLFFSNKTVLLKEKCYQFVETELTHRQLKIKQYKKCTVKINKCKVTVIEYKHLNLVWGNCLWMLVSSIIYAGSFFFSSS